MQRDVIIIGGGPAGLSLAVALADAGLTVTVVERQARGALACPAMDGRDIALTHRAMGILRTLEIWDRFPATGISPIRQAWVLNGTSPQQLRFDSCRTGRSALGYLVANHIIRKAAFEAATARAAVRLITEATIATVATDAGSARVCLTDGEVLTAPLLVAADSRHSETRRRLGIGADLRDFGRVVIVCRMTHARAHDGIAHECFQYGGTLAILPLNGNLVSAVITVSTDKSAQLLEMAPEKFNAWVRDRFESRLGDMALHGERYAYPLVAVYAHRFATERFALVGDAAVGMHPVTAHGFNFGLYGVDSLTRHVRTALAANDDIGSVAVLGRYDAEHRRATRPIYLGTNALVGLFTDDRMPARMLRRTVLRLAARLPPLKWGITRQLTGTGTGT